ncbi:type II toxin-antitoxin system RelE/ParE family toxin [Mucilaginibacter terrigena]|uniref:Type II toxin-antitoxin system RelE/ParE family toxin n=1 Tax=Mucilaginibacter terrigena TaxID=2492395 RepID=A0A4V1ZBI6_9SPHI|nr:type II toxin-antitoxin system RelE/ParE family toxin [Mucilaginibacter terrigena]RYU87879.1 type II toxin-antitoxin system RelE/ParE family toxin [Mucilaginibacter terrigena]
MAKRLVISKKAYTDIDKIVEFNNYRNKSKTYSEKFIKNLQKQLTLLVKHPLIGKHTDMPDTLLLVWDNYYIFYIDNEDTIEIRSIYHQRENVPFK